MKILCNYFVTLRCNSKCDFCAIWSREPQKNVREQTLAEVESNLRDLKLLGIKLIDFTGGEPLLYSHLREALNLAKKLGFYTTVTTNGILYPQYAEDLQGLIDVLYFSLLSHQEKKHNATAGVKSYNKVIESMDIARRLRQKAYLRHTVTDNNFAALPAIIKFAQERKSVLCINPCFSYFGNEGLSQILAKQLARYRREPYVRLNLALMQFIVDGGNRVGQSLCQAVKNIMAISPDNHLLLPCYNHCLHKLKIDNNLRELYNSKVVQDIAKKSGKYPFCRGCTISCYMQTSYFKKYPFLFLATWLKNLREILR